MPAESAGGSEHSEGGEQLRRALEFRAALQNGNSVDPEDVTSEEFQAMLVLDAEQESREPERDSG